MRDVPVRSYPAGQGRRADVDGVTNVSAAVPLPIRQPRAARARQVADVLRHQILSGAYDDGLPGELELAADFSVSRNTIRAALTTLKNEGLIDRGPKVGTHVAQRKYNHRLDTLLGLKETFKTYGEVRNEVRAVMTVSAPLGGFRSRGAGCAERGAQRRRRRCACLRPPGVGFGVRVVQRRRVGHCPPGMATSLRTSAGSSSIQACSLRGSGRT